MKYIKQLLVPSFVIALPLFVYAAPFTNTKGLITGVGEMVTTLIGIVGAIALLVFFWGLAKFIFRVGGDEKAVDEGKTLMKWGLAALFVMFSVWGLIAFFQGELGLEKTVNPTNNSQPVPNPLNPESPFRNM